MHRVMLAALLTTVLTTTGAITASAASMQGGDLTPVAPHLLIDHRFNEEFFVSALWDLPPGTWFDDSTSFSLILEQDGVPVDPSFAENPRAYVGADTQEVFNWDLPTDDQPHTYSATVTTHLNGRTATATTPAVIVPDATALPDELPASVPTTPSFIHATIDGKGYARFVTGTSEHARTSQLQVVTSSGKRGPLISAGAGSMHFAVPVPTDRRYRIRFRTGNEFGWAPWITSNELESFVPAAVTHVRATHRTAHAFTLTWRRPSARGGAPLTTYTLHIRWAGPHGWTYIADLVTVRSHQGTLHYRAKHIPNGRYMAWVVGSNAHGWGPAHYGKFLYFTIG